MKKLFYALFTIFVSISGIGQQKHLTKKEAIQYIKSYYSNFKTGSYEYDSYES